MSALEKLSSLIQLSAGLNIASGVFLDYHARRLQLHADYINYAKTEVRPHAEKRGMIGRLNYLIAELENALLKHSFKNKSAIQAIRILCSISAILLIIMLCIPALDLGEIFPQNSILAQALKKISDTDQHRPITMLTITLCSFLPFFGGMLYLWLYHFQTSRKLMPLKNSLQEAVRLSLQTEE
ncbi:hypothetical protein [Chromobacterium violaceum]|uniref:Uncharacterized protein n=1 Tax=Chromobacterium violaceum (strain ATCC 12472 / DSM 30191 / JCM 1249 / CCUG 213 / NBRC 12614 / NCIMB 9131 / NCTC 9757 / MK) TaxID=243365 RepID=Q7NVS5_CHRVO|nr:hypothetical protein [Chromobacterium violaceum]AAQ59939.1 hypothetical protein CV_2267 [Chromobacterium violaceum ATCC 12472]